MDFLQLGNTAIKGGIFFGNQLTPSGVFKNIPDSFQPNVFITDDTSQGQTIFNRCNANIQLTLDKLKESISNELDSDVVVTDKLFREFLSNSAKLLIDYRDLRNFIFFGSSYTELSYNLVHLIDNFPYKAYIASASNEIDIQNNSNKTYVKFTNNQIIKGLEVFNLKETQIENLTDFVVTDKNGRQYKVLDFESPEYNPIVSINFLITGVELTTQLPHLLQNSDEIKIKLCNISELNNYYYVEIIDATTIRLYENHLLTSPKIISTTQVYDGSARVRLKKPIYNNQYTIRLILQGNLTSSQYISLVEGVDTYEGFLLQRNNQYYIEFDNSITDFQRQLLNKTITKPWPREVITENITFKSQEFEQWILDPGNFRLEYNYDDDPGYIENYYSDLKTELTIASAIIMDEDETNQLLRKSMPAYVIDELRDQDSMFKRFVLIAAWLFDQLRLYINFITYNHHIDYTQYNQLTYQYYDLYSKHFGLDLFEEDNIELSKLLVQTEPGLIYVDNIPKFQDTDNSKTLYLLQKEKQKRLLINLMHLYKGKGTMDVLSKLIELLGVPKGLVLINEFYMDFTSKDINGTPLNNNKVRLIDNEKVHTPKIVWEIDTNKLINPNNVNDLINLPYFYKQTVDNQWSVNLREIDLITSPQDALLYDLMRWGQAKYDYCKFKEGGFCSLQNVAADYYLLPLSFPDKYCGFVFEYCIPKQTINEISNQFTLCSLFHVADMGTEPMLITKGLKYNYLRERFGFYNQASFSIIGLSGMGTGLIQIDVLGETICSTTEENTIEQTSRKICNIINTSTVSEKFFASYNGDKIVISSKDITLNGAELEITTDLIIDNIEVFSDTTSIIDDNYIICKIENSRLVVRLRYVDEFNPTLITTRFESRITKSNYIFNDDGLNHRMELKLRPGGVELYQDFEYVEFMPWRELTPQLEITWDVRTLPFNLIEQAIITPLDIEFFAEPTNTGSDQVRWWDMFVGDAHRIDVWVKEIQVYENREINLENLQLGATYNDTNYSVESWLFKPNIVTNSFDAYYQAPFPLIDGQDDSLNSLPTNNNNKVYFLNLLPYNSFAARDCLFENTKQDFFEGVDLTTSIIQLYKLKGWDNNLHQQEVYNLLESMLINYFVFGRQVITYINLLSIIQLIEKKFKILSSQFIPIVINTNNFARLIQPEAPNKFRYRGAYKNCIIDNLGRRASLRIDFTFGEPYISWFSFDMAPYGNTGQIDWEQSSFYTLKKLGELWKNVANPDAMSYRVGNNTIYLEIDLLWLEEDIGGTQADLASYRNTILSTFDSEDVNIIVHDWDIGQMPNRVPIQYQQLPCFQIEYTLPEQEIDDNYYIYYNGEPNNSLNNYVYYDSETGKYYRHIE